MKPGKISSVAAKAATAPSRKPVSRREGSRLRILHHSEQSLARRATDAAQQADPGIARHKAEQNCPGKANRVNDIEENRELCGKPKKNRQKTGEGEERDEAHGFCSIQTKRRPGCPNADPAALCLP